MNLHFWQSERRVVAKKAKNVVYVATIPHIDLEEVDISAELRIKYVAFNCGENRRVNSYLCCEGGRGVTDIVRKVNFRM